MTNGLTRGVPVQDLPENQDPSVRYTVNQVTGEITVWDVEEAKPKRKVAKKAVALDVVEEAGDPGAEAGAGGWVEVAATSLRELGS